MKKTFLWLILGFLSLIAAATAFKPESASGAAVALTGPPTKSAAANEPWQEKWNEMLLAARKEGRVRIYQGNPKVNTQLAKAFQEKFGINVELVTGRSQELQKKISVERTAALFLADIYQAGPDPTHLWEYPGTVYDPMRPGLVLPEVVDGKAWWGGKIPFADPKGEYVVFPCLTADSGLAYNTQLVKPGQLASVQDLLKPEFKKRLAMIDPTFFGPGRLWTNMMLMKFSLAADYMKDLAKQEPFLTRDPRLLVESLARGKYAVAIGPHPATIDEFQEKGAPLRWAMVKETFLAPNESTVALFNRAPHPNAARVYLNWYLSKEGQTLFARNTGFESVRLDVDNHHLLPEKRRDPARKYPVLDAEFVNPHSKLRDRANETVAGAFRGLLK